MTGRAGRALAAMAMLAGCSSGTPEEQAATAATTSPSPSAPATAADAAPPPTSAAPSRSAADSAGSVPPTAPPAAPASAPAGPRNAASAVTDGLAVTVVAEHGPEYGSSPRFRIQVRLENQSSETAYYALGQADYAAIADDGGTVRWRSTDCNPTLETYEISGGVAPLQPDEAVDVVVDYPDPPRQVSRAGDEDCGLPDGAYQLRGFFPVCRRGTQRETSNPGTFSCAEQDVELIGSGTLGITIGASR